MDKYYVLRISGIIITSLYVFTGCVEHKIDPKYYSGQSINSEWDVQSVCSTARMMIKSNYVKSKADSLYSLKCTVSKVNAPLPGIFAVYDPYAVTWPNGVAARVFITSKGLKVIGTSENGIPASWN